MEIISNADNVKCQHLFLGKVRKYFKISFADIFTQSA